MNSFGMFGSLAMLLGIAWSVLWLVIGWRAMKAHENLADSVHRLSQLERTNPLLSKGV